MLPVRYRFWDVPFHTPLRDEVTEVFARMLKEEKMHMVFTPNPEIMLVSEDLPEYKEVLQSAYWNLPDGHGILWASTFLEKTKNIRNKLFIILIFLKTYADLVINKKALQRIIPETVTGADTFFKVHSLFVERRIPVFYFGGEDGVDKEIGATMEKKYPGLQVAGSCGGFPFRSKEENEAILSKIEDAAPEVVFVALTFPRQEMWIQQNSPRLEKAGVKVAMGIGGTFNFAVGRIKRAPQWMQNLHIEWLWRLIMEPRRMRRILKAVLYFPWKVLQKKLNAYSSFSE